LTIRELVSDDSSMDSRCAAWCLVLGVAACTPLPQQESSRDTAVTRQPQVEERLRPFAPETSRLLEKGPPATLIEWVETPESLHPKFPSDWRVLVIQSDRQDWDRVPIYGAIQDWHK
jgi:hypothetical protein